MVTHLGCNHLVQHNKQYHMKKLLSHGSFHLNGYTLGFHPQTSKLEPRIAQHNIQYHMSFYLNGTQQGFIDELYFSIAKMINSVMSQSLTLKVKGITARKTSVLSASTNIVLFPALVVSKITVIFEKRLQACVKRLKYSRSIMKALDIAISMIQLSSSTLSCDTLNCLSP